MAFSPYCLLKLPKCAGQEKEPGSWLCLKALPKSMSLPSHVFPFFLISPEKKKQICLPSTRRRTIWPTNLADFRA